MLTVEQLRAHLRYDPDTGAFTRLAGQYQGQPAGHVMKSTGHVQLWVAGEKYLGHRLAWLYMTGEWPVAQIDHKNRKRADNRWSNLREATHAQNCINRVSYSRKYDLPRGVTFYRGRFLARIKAEGLKSRYLGSYETPAEAHAAYMTAALESHGDFLPKAAA